MKSLFPLHAPILIGAAFFSAFAISCKRSGTPDWPETRVEVRQEPAAAPPVEKLSDDGEAGQGLRFMTYNVKNWLAMERRDANGKTTSTSKPEAEKQAVIDLIAKHQPDVLGICEIGTREDLQQLQLQLEAAGLSLPYLVHTGGTDPVRHLGLLSKFPIVSTAKAVRTEYQLDGKTMGIQRGILDATLDAHKKRYRFIGVHLKSRREVEMGDEERMRTHEARLVREHIDSILAADPAARLIVYGDFNDTRSTPTLKTLVGDYNDPGYLFPVPAKDSRDETWTHYWAATDTYSRIDFITVSRSLKVDTDFDSSRLIDDKAWNKGSDHRPVMAIFR